MGEFQFGIYVYVWTWVLLIGALVDFGLASAAQRFIPEYLGLRAFALLRGFLSGSRWLTLAIATALAALAALGIRVLEPWIGQYEIVPLYLACATLPMFALTHMQEGIARAYGWVNIALLPPYIVRSLVLVAAMGAARVLGFATDAVTAMTAAVIATCATTARGSRRSSPSRSAGPSGPRSPRPSPSSRSAARSCGCSARASSTAIRSCSFSPWARWRAQRSGRSSGSSTWWASSAPARSSTAAPSRSISSAASC